MRLNTIQKIFEKYRAAERIKDTPPPFDGFSSSLGALGLDAS